MTKQQILTLSTMASMIITSGCASMAADNSQAVARSGSATSMELQAAQRRVTELESALAASESDLVGTKSRLSTSDKANASMASGSDNRLFPPNPVAGLLFRK